MADFYTVKEAVEILKVTRQTVTRYIREGKIKSYRLGGVGPWRIDPASLEAFSRGETGTGKATGQE